jgi:hypothetical protein
MFLETVQSNGKLNKIFGDHQLFTSYSTKIPSKQKLHISARSIIYHTQFHKPQTKCRRSRSRLTSSPVSHISITNCRKLEETYGIGVTSNGIKLISSSVKICQLIGEFKVHKHTHAHTFTASLIHTMMTS